MSKFNQPIATVLPDDTTLTAFPAAAAAAAGGLQIGLLKTLSISVNTAFNTTANVFENIGSVSSAGIYYGHTFQVGSSDQVHVRTTRDSDTALTIDHGAGWIEVVPSAEVSNHHYMPMMVPFSDSWLTEMKNDTSDTAEAWGAMYYCTESAAWVDGSMNYDFLSDFATVTDTYTTLHDLTGSGQILGIGFVNSGSKLFASTHMKITVDSTTIEWDLAVNRVGGHVSATDTYGYLQGPWRYETACKIEIKDDTATSGTQQIACLRTVDN